MRRDTLWILRNGALVPVIDAPILLPEGQYIGFGGVSGDSGYGFRDNGGVLQFKDEGGTWEDFGTGSGAAEWGLITGTLSDQTDLQNALDAKQDTSEKGAANGYAPLDASTLIPSAYLPPLAITEYLGNFADLTAALANAGVQASQRGDWFTTTSDGSYVVVVDNPTIPADVTQITTPGGGVTSVNGQTGVVSLDAADVGAEVPLTFSTGLTRATNTITANLSTGVPGGQTMYGGTAANDDLTIHGTSHATKTSSYILLNPSGGHVGVGTSAPVNMFVVGGQQTGNAGLEVVPTSSLLVQSYNRNTSAYAALVFDASTFSFRPGGTQAMHITASQEVVVGSTTSGIARFAVSGTYTTANGSSVLLGVTLNSSVTSSQYGIQNAMNFGPTGASLGNLYGQYVNPSLTAGSTPVTSFFGQRLSIETGASYTGQVATGYALRIDGPTIAGTLPMTNYYGTYLVGGTNGTGITSGTIINYGQRIVSATAAPGLGGTITNYGLAVNVPTGSGDGTTTNYALHISGVGGTAGAGTTTNYSLYNNSTAVSYFSANVGFGGLSAPLASIDAMSSTGGNIAISSSDTSIASADTLGTLGFYTRDTTVTSQQMAASIKAVAAAIYSTDAAPAHLVFSTQDTTLATAAAERMRITSTGNVGIGTTNPVYKLQIGDGTAVASAYSRGTHAYFGLDRSSSSNTAYFNFSTNAPSAPDFQVGLPSGAAVFTIGNNNFATKFVSVLTTGEVGVNTTAPDRLFHVEVSGSATNTVVYAARFSHVSSSTVATNFGTGIEFELENASGTNRVASAQELTWSDATNASEDATWTLKLMRAGTLTEGLRLASTGALTINNAYTLPTAVPGANGYVLTGNTDGSTSWAAASGGGSGSATSRSITQAAHGLAVGELVRLSAADTYTKAQADSAANAEVVGIVSAVADANTFTLTTGGYVSGLSGLTANTVYFLSPSSAGAMTATEPTTTGQVSKPVFVASSTTAGYFVNMRGELLAASVTNPSVRVYQTASTSVTTSWDALSFGAENFDTDTMHDNATNNSRITFTTAGKYQVGGGWRGNTNNVVGVRIRLNGSTILATQKQGNSGNPEHVNVSTIYQFAAGDYVELQGYSGTTMNSTGDADCTFWAYKID